MQELNHQSRSCMTCMTFFATNAAGARSAVMEDVQLLPTQKLQSVHAGSTVSAAHLQEECPQRRAFVRTVSRPLLPIRRRVQRHSYASVGLFQVNDSNLLSSAAGGSTTPIRQTNHLLKYAGMNAWQ